MVDTPWIAEGRWPTGEEWRRWFLSLPPDEQLALAEKAVSNDQIASRRFMLDPDDDLMADLEGSERLRRPRLRIGPIVHQTNPAPPDPMAGE